MKQQTLTEAAVIEIGKLPDTSAHAYDVSLPLSLDSIRYPAMGLDTIKAWYFLISIVRKTTKEEYRKGVCSYTLPSLDIARNMNMKQPRGIRVRNALLPLTHFPVQVTEGDGKDLDQKYIANVNLLMFLAYNGHKQKKPIQLLIHPIVNDLIFHSREIIHFDYYDIARLSSVASIHVFTVLWRLHLQHIHTISVAEFKEKLGVSDKYKKFARFAQVYIAPVEADIRLNTRYKDFHISFTSRSPAGKKIPVTQLYFSFSSKEEEETDTRKLIELAGKISKPYREIIKEFTPATQELFSELFERGYAVNTYINLILKVIRECSEGTFYHKVIAILLEAGKRDLTGKYGRFLTKTLKDALHEKQSPREIVRNNIKQYSFEEQQKWMKTFLLRAKEEFRSMSVDQRQEILSVHQAAIAAQMHNKAFHPEDVLAVHPDGRRASCKAFIEFLADAYQTGKLVPQTTLFG